MKDHIQYLLQNQGGLSVKELSRQTNISLSMVHRYLKELEQGGLISKVGHGPKVRYVSNNDITSAARSESVRFGPPHAVFNLSKLGLRYFRICCNVPTDKTDQLIKLFSVHPNVGWVFSATGWFNFAIGLWVSDNAEINAVANQIRSLLPSEAEIVFQSELVSLYGFGNRPVVGETPSMCIIDSKQSDLVLSRLERDYIKLLAVDSSVSSIDFAKTLNISIAELEAMHSKLLSSGIVSGFQERINYQGIYFKVFLDTHSTTDAEATDKLMEKLWHDMRCIYIAPANSKYDLEFEVILEHASDIQIYLRDFSSHETVFLQTNHYTNLYPLNKVANLNHITETILSQKDQSVISLQNSKLWYLNPEGSEAYLNIYNNPDYFELMAQDEIQLFPAISDYINDRWPTKKINVVDLGSGDGKKGRKFIEAVGAQNVAAYYPVDIQTIELQVALLEHARGQYPKHPVLLDFENLSARFPLPQHPLERDIYLMLGGTYGNYDAEKINSYLQVLSRSGGLLFVAISITDRVTQAAAVVSAYTNRSVEDVSFGPLLQFGFKKEDFIENAQYPSLRMHAAIEGDQNVISFTLKRDTEVGGQLFIKDTVFKVTTSWKPTVEEFVTALEKNFTVEKVFSNKSFAIAAISLI